MNVPLIVSASLIFVALLGAYFGIIPKEAPRLLLDWFLSFFRPSLQDGRDSQPPIAPGTPSDSSRDSSSSSSPPSEGLDTSTSELYPPPPSSEKLTP